MQEQRDYINGVEYKGGVLDRLAHSEGAVVNQAGAYVHEYNIKDHLGNTRVTYSDANNDGVLVVSDMVQLNHYYPFGMNMEGNWNGAAGSNKYGYNGKEWNDDFGLGWNHHDWRFLDVAINRFVTIDPESEEEEQEGFSPYHFSANNPIRYSDPDGRFPIIPVIWAIYEVGSAIYDGYQAYKTVSDKNASTGEKVIAVTGVVVSAVLPGGGYGTVANTTVKAIDNVTDVVKAVDKVADAKNVIAKADDVKTAITPYKRPNNATTKAQRESVQGKSCVDCGEKSKKMIADHKEPLVKEHYRTGKIDKTKMKAVDSVQPQCPTCSARQGADMSKFSKEQKKKLNNGN